MKCLNCGGDVKFAVNICPHCHSNNSANQFAGCATLLIAIPIGLIVGAAKASWVWGLVAFVVFWLLINLAGQESYKKSNKKRDLL